MAFPVNRVSDSSGYDRKPASTDRWTAPRATRTRSPGVGGSSRYDNIEVEKHVERVVNEDHAQVIRRIFDLCATGAGYSRIAKTLNAERAVAPRPQQGRPAGWAPSTVRDVLHRELYRGIVVWDPASDSR